MIAREHGWAEFISIQNHYNLIYREEEREMMQLLEEEKIVMTPYSALAAGRLCRLPDAEETLRVKDDPNSNFKYDHCKDIDAPIIKRVKEVADKMKISMTLVALAWIYSKPLVVSPVLGFTKMSHLDEAMKVFNIKLSEEDIKYLEELYVPHPTIGALKKPIK